MMSSDTNDIKIADFGLSTYFDEKHKYLKGQVGTLHYMSPELVRGKKHDKSVDIWSLGVIAYQLLS